MSSGRLAPVAKSAPVASSFVFCGLSLQKVRNCHTIYSRGRLRRPFAQKLSCDASFGSPDRASYCFSRRCRAATPASCFEIPAEHPKPPRTANSQAAPAGTRGTGRTFLNCRQCSVAGTAAAFWRNGTALLPELRAPTSLGARVAGQLREERHLWGIILNSFSQRFRPEKR